MPRTIPAGQLTEIAKNVTVPVYLVQLGFNTPLYYSSKQQIVFDSNTYLEDKLSKVSLNDNEGIISGTLSISNIDLSIGGVALSETLQGKTCKIYTVTTTAGTTTDAILYLDGVVTGVSNISEKEVTLEFSTVSANIAFSPRIYCSSPLFNHIIPTGSIINWADTVYELVGSSS